MVGAIVSATVVKGSVTLLASATLLMALTPATPAVTVAVYAVLESSAWLGVKVTLLIAGLKLKLAARAAAAPSAFKMKLFVKLVGRMDALKSATMATFVAGFVPCVGAGDKLKATVGTVVSVPANTVNVQGMVTVEFATFSAVPARSVITLPRVTV